MRYGKGRRSQVRRKGYAGESEEGRKEREGERSKEVKGVKGEGKKT